MNPKYTLEYFIKKFEDIPEDQWFEGDFTDKTGTRHCALGHCGFELEGDGLGLVIETPEGRSLSRLFESAVTVLNYTSVTIVNDGLNNLYQQTTPKQRILAALQDISKMEKK